MTVDTPANDVCGGAPRGLRYPNGTTMTLLTPDTPRPAVIPIIRDGESPPSSNSETGEFDRRGNRMARIRRALLLLIAAAVVPMSIAACGDGPPAEGTPEQNAASVSPTISSPSPNTGATVPTATTSSSPQQAAVTAQQIVERAFKTSQEITSFKFDMDFAMSFNLPAGNEGGTMTMEQTGTGAVDLTQREMALAMNVSMDIPKQGRQSGTAEIYLTDGWMYMGADAGGGANQWTKMKLTDELWAAQSRFSGMTDLLKAPVGLETLGSEVVGGVDCYVLNITPNMTSLSDWVAGQAQAGQDGGGSFGADMSKTFKNFVVKQWIAKDSLLPVKQTVVIAMDTTSGGRHHRHETRHECHNLVS